MPQTIKISCSGYEIFADWYQGTDPAKVLLVLPGYKSSRKKGRHLNEKIVEITGTSILVIDYSGQGDSPFDLREVRPAQQFLEVIYAFDWLAAKYPQAEISVSGSSYGGFLATQLTKYRSFKNLILRAPAIYNPANFYTPWANRLNDEQAYTRES